MGPDRGGGVAHPQALSRRRGASSTSKGRAAPPCPRSAPAICARSRRRATVSWPASAIVKPLVELRVPFELDRQQIDDVERGANDSDWQPVKDAARQHRLRRGPRDLRRLRRRPASKGFARAPAIRSMTLAGRRARLSRRDRPGAEPVASGRRQRPLLGVARRRRLYRAQRDQRPRLSGAGAHQAPGERRNHLGAGDRGRLRAHDPRRRLRPAYRPGRLDRLFQPHRRDRHACICRKPSPSSYSRRRLPWRWLPPGPRRRNPTSAGEGSSVAQSLLGGQTRAAIRSSGPRAAPSSFARPAVAAGQRMESTTRAFSRPNDGAAHAVSRSRPAPRIRRPPARS